MIRPVKRRAAAARVCGGLATAVVGALSFVSAVTPDVPWRRHLLMSVEPGPALGLGHVLAALGGLALVYLAWGIVRRRRRAVDAARRRSEQHGFTREDVRTP
jgi:protein-S-isoprenylcysteine O-methyltransferase Ste14